MRKIKTRGIFISFEGGEGSGKTTQCGALADWLKAQGFSVVITREPGATPLGQKIRKILLHSPLHLPSLVELLLYEADRANHVATVVRPALKAGNIVLCDRFTDATLAYQGYARKLPKSLIRILNRIATGGLKPDLTFLFDLPPEEGLRRASRRKTGPDRLEREALTFHRRVREGYLTLAKKETTRFRIIDVRKSKLQIFRKLCAELEKFGLPFRGAARLR